MPPPARVPTPADDREGRLAIIAPAVREIAGLVDRLLPGAQVVRLLGQVPRRREWRDVLLVAHDLQDLRATATAIGAIGTAPRVTVCLERQPQSIPAAVRQPDWPALDEVFATRGTPTIVRLGFSEPVQVRGVVTMLARACTPSMAPTIQWPALGARRDEPRHWPVNDPTATVAPPVRLYATDVDLPPDVITVDNPEGAEQLEHHSHPVLGRAPTIVRADSDLTWAELDEATGQGPRSTRDRLVPVSLGPIDDKLFNPIGFDRSRAGRPAPLRGRPDGSMVAASADGGATLVVADRTGRVSDADLPELRTLPGLHIEWSGCRGPQDLCRVVATLACAGVPLVADSVPDWAQRLLAPELAAALTEPTDLDDELAREEHSIRTRRFALLAHASSPWRCATAASAGAQEVALPKVSVLLVTRRPEMLGFALRQVARQRGADFELVLAAHGFEPAASVLADFADRCGAPVTVVRADPTTPFGGVLNQAVTRSCGDVVLKVDDDDWYGPDFVRDLLLARSYSNAALVGAFPEITYLEPLDVTIRRAGPTEAYNMFVAGGTLMVSREVLRGLGGFRETRKYVDASIIRSVHHSGAGVYRTHGLGYVLRRRASGHTWEPGLGYFLSEQRVVSQWRGFRPSSVLDVDRPDVPGASVDVGVVSR